MSLPAGPRPRTVEILAAALLALLLAGLVDAFTETMPPRWDPEVYVDMARNGVLGNDHLVAPYAYRPAVPLLAGWLSRALEIPLQDAFQGLSRLAVFGSLFLSFLIARRFTGRFRTALLPLLFTATAVMPVKFALFVPTSVDAAGFCAMMLAAWAHLAGRKTLALWVSAIGLFFKEFLAIPLLLGIAERFRAWRRERTARAGAALAGSSALALAVIALPRLLLKVAETQQEIDPLNNLHSLGRLVMNPLNPGRDLNIMLCLLAFWLPVILLLTRDRLRTLLADLAPLRSWLAGFLALDLLLTLYGGTNLFIFVSYALPVQVLVLARLAASDRGPARWEWALALACTAAYNRVLGTIPLPEDGFDAYIDYYAGWSSRVNLSTALRFLEIAAYAGVLFAVRRFTAARLRKGQVPC